MALRKLVEVARKENADADRKRQALEASYRFMSEVAGNEYGFEEAARSLFAGDKEGFEANMAKWPADLREFAHHLAEGAFAPPPTNRSLPQSRCSGLDDPLISGASVPPL